jgi:hypothetical protein
MPLPGRHTVTGDDKDWDAHAKVAKWSVRGSAGFDCVSPKRRQEVWVCGQLSELPLETPQDPAYPAAGDLIDRPPKGPHDIPQRAWRSCSR